MSQVEITPNDYFFTGYIGQTNWLHYISMRQKTYFEKSIFTRLVNLELSS